jgi:hypothetical protein
MNEIRLFLLGPIELMVSLLQQNVVYKACYELYCVFYIE